MDTIIIRKITLTDIEEWQTISRQTFLETFEESNSKENMKKYIEESFNTNKLITEIENSNSKIFFATFNNKAIGYLKLNFGQAQIELKNEKGFEIERIFILKDFFGKKVGQILLDYALQIAKQIKSEYIWLGVLGKNSRAIRFYSKNGFVEFDKHLFKLGDDMQTDLMMKLEIHLPFL